MIFKIASNDFSFCNEKIQPWGVFSLHLETSLIWIKSRKKMSYYEQYKTYVV